MADVRSEKNTNTRVSMKRKINVNKARQVFQDFADWPSVVFGDFNGNPKGVYSSIVKITNILWNGEWRKTFSGFRGLVH